MPPISPVPDLVLFFFTNVNSGLEKREPEGAGGTGGFCSFVLPFLLRGSIFFHLGPGCTLASLIIPLLFYVFLIRCSKNGGEGEHFPPCSATRGEIWRTHVAQFCLPKQSRSPSALFITTIHSALFTHSHVCTTPFLHSFILLSPSPPPKSSPESPPPPPPLPGGKMVKQTSQRLSLMYGRYHLRPSLSPKTQKTRTLLFS